MPLHDDPDRCAFTFRDGRRCRMLRSSEHPLLCPHHARQEQRENGVALAEPPPLLAAGALDTPWAVRRTLKRLFAEVVDDRLSPAHAKAAGYIGRMLLIETRRARPKRKRARGSLPAAKRARGTRP